MMKNEPILNQLALNTNLLSQEISEAILEGNPPPIEEIVLALVVGGIDANAMTSVDPKATWIGKRLARMALAGVVLTALAVLGGEKENV